MPKILRSARSQAPIFRALRFQISLGSVTDFPPIIPPQERRALGYFLTEVGTPSWVYSRRCFHVKGSTFPYFD